MLLSALAALVAFSFAVQDKAVLYAQRAHQCAEQEFDDSTQAVRSAVPSGRTAPHGAACEGLAEVV